MASPQTQESYRSLEEGALDPGEREPSSPIPELQLPPSPTFTELSEPCEVLVNRTLHPESSFDPPDGYAIYDRTIANHINYGAKIRLSDDRQVWPHYIHFDHDFVDHKHYIMGRYDETGLHTNTVGWTLEAAPFVGPALAYPNNTSLKPFAFAHSCSDAIDLALGALDDPGLLADVDRH